MLALALASVGLLASQAFAFQPDVAAIVARQFDPTSTGTQCQDTCSAVTQLQVCTPLPQCFCTEQFNQGVLDCYNCILGLSGNSPQEAQSLQVGLQVIEDDCSSEGHPLQSLSVQGSKPTSAANPTTAAEGAAATTTPSSGGSAGGSSSPTSPTTAPTQTQGSGAAGSASNAVSDARVGSLVVLAGALGCALGAFML